MADYLDEDPLISNQKYAVFSYVLSDKNPMVKFRGAYSSTDECKSRIKRLQAVDSYFHMFVIEVGKWGALLTNEELNNTEITQEFQDTRMNEMMKAYKEEREKAQIDFENRRNEMTKKLKYDGTKEGQEKLASEKEHPMSVKIRLEDTSALLEKIKKDLEEYTKVYEDTKAKYEAYTQEEIEKAENDIKNMKIE